MREPRRRRQQQDEEDQVQRRDPGDGETVWGRVEGWKDRIKKEGLIVNGRLVWKSSLKMYGGK